MSGETDTFEAETDVLADIRLVEAGEYLHEYTGIVTETEERVRLLTLSQELAETAAAVNAFSQVSDRWYNASANATILTIRDRGTEPRPWIGVPDHGGETLATLQPELSPEVVERIVTETGDALRTLGLYNTVHGHLSPDDVYLPDATDKTEAPSVRVGGFGLEAAVQDAVGEFGPTAYTAPELLDNPGRSAEHTDVYGLATVTYFALTGEPPIAGTDFEQAIRDGPPAPPSTYADGITDELDDVISKALATRPKNRYDSPYTFTRAFVSAYSPDAISPSDSAGETDGETETAAVSTEMTDSAGDDTPPSKTADSDSVSGEDDSSEPDERDPESRETETDNTTGSSVTQTKNVLVVTAVVASGLSLVGSTAAAGDSSQNLAIATVLFICGVGSLALGLVIAIYGVEL